MDFSPRLIQILILLLNSENPIPATILAEKLQISKRTLSRELENIDNGLEAYDLKIDKKLKKGIKIIGKNEDKERFKEYLEKFECFDPKNIEQRQDRIIEEILKEEEIPKAYYLSSMLKVSETTINNDLINVKKWFAENGIKLIRKSNIGIYIDYEEDDYRKSCMRYIESDISESQEKLLRMIDEDIVEGVAEILSDVESERIERMSRASYIELHIYLSLSVYRIKKGKKLIFRNKAINNINSEEKIIVDFIVDKLEKKFDVNYSEDEMMYVYLYIAGSKKLDAIESEDFYKNNDELLKVIYKLIESYDSEISYYLKNDELFIKGLVNHLKPTILRLKNGIRIRNPYNDEVKNSYPEIYNKISDCSYIISDFIGVEIPEEEIGLIAVHFGGAEVRLNKKYKKIRKIHMGVVCGSGIGISTLLCSRILNLFKERVDVKKFSLRDLNKIKKDDIDIMISTFELDNYQEKYIKVNPILKEEDIEKISNELDNLMLRPKPIQKIEKDLTKDIDEITLISTEISSIIKNFKIYKMKQNTDFITMARFIGSIASDEHDGVEEITERIIKREQLSTQVIPEFEMAFLHTKSKFVEMSKFFIINPEEGCFERLSNSKTVIAMIIPEEDSRQTLAISSISEAIFEDEKFLEEIKNSCEETTKLYVDRILREYLINKVREI